jgi:hypothetical protein
MIERDARWQSELEVVAAIGREFERAAELEDRTPRLLRPFLPRTRRALALALAGALVAVGGAGAATGVLPGSIIPGEEAGVSHDAGPGPDQTVLATGTSPVAGPWRLTTYRSEGLSNGNEVVEAKGLPCVLLQLTDPPEQTFSTASSFCLAPGKPDFNMSGLLAASADAKELLMYGFAPMDTAAVELSVAGGKTTRSQAHDGRGAFPGKVWVMPVAPGATSGELTRVNADGRPMGTPRDASAQLKRLP